MPGEIRYKGTPGQTVKGLIVGEDGKVWNGSAMVAVSTLSDVEWTASLVACPEEDTSDSTGMGLYLANWPGALTQNAMYSVVFFSGASPSPGDQCLGIQDDPTEYTATSGGTGSGARTVAVTVDDGSDPLENATVRFTEGVNTHAGSTDASGEVAFSLDDATYALAISKPGYSFTPTTLVVDGDETETYSMSAVSISAPPNASTTTGVMTVYDEEGSVEESVEVSVQIIDGPGTDGIGYDSTVWTETSSALGVVEFAGIIHGARYKIWRGDSKPNAQTFTAPTSGDSFDLAEVIGRG